MLYRVWKLAINSVKNYCAVILCHESSCIHGEQFDIDFALLVFTARRGVDRVGNRGVKVGLRRHGGIAVVGVRLPGFRSQLYHLIAVSSWLS